MSPTRSSIIAVAAVAALLTATCADPEQSSTQPSASGQGIKLVSVDGIVAGEVNGVIESNPTLGPLVFATIEKSFADQPVGATIIIQDTEYDEAVAKSEVGNAY